MSDEITVILEVNEVIVVQQDTDLSLAASGPQGPTGPQGPAGAAGGSVYLHTQSVASATWVINHNVGRPVSVTLFDATGRVVFSDIEHGTANQATVTWSTPTTGSALVV